jgi:hypothetical protein
MSKVKPLGASASAPLGLAIVISERAASENTTLQGVGTRCEPEATMTAVRSRVGESLFTETWR